MVKIAYITTIPITQWAFLRGQNSFLCNHGFDLHAVSSPGLYLDRLAERDGVTIHPVPISRRITPLRDLVSLLRLVAVLRRVRPAIAHVSTPKAALLGAIAAWIARVPVRIFLARGLITEGTRGPRRALLRSLERLTARLCHETICVAPSLLQFARAEGILKPGRGVVVARGMSNGIDLGRFDPEAVTPATLPPGFRPDGGPIIGFVGRLARDKGLGDLSEAWSMIRDDYPDARLLIVGAWEEDAPVPPSVRRAMESDPRVLFVGGQVDVGPYYRCMSMLVFPSHREGFPNAPMEAAAMGLPVIATRVVGCIDAVIDGETGTLVPPHYPVDLAGAIRQYLIDPDLGRRRGRAGRERVKRDYRQEVIWEALHHEYVRLLAARSLTAPAGSPRLGRDPGA